MSRLLLAALLLAGGTPAAAAAEREGAAGLRVLYRRASDGSRLLSNGTVEPEFWGEMRKPGSRSALEVSLGGSRLASSESGDAVYTGGSGSVPTRFTWEQELVVMPVRFTYKYGPAGERLAWHLGGGAGVVLGLLTQKLSFSDPQADADLSIRDYDSIAAFELHLQGGAEWRVSDRFRLGALARWSHARAQERVFSGFRSASAAGARFDRGEKLGNVAGLQAGASASWRFGG